MARAVILAAGYGSRLLPVTRTVPKELLPIVDVPAIQLVVDELVEAGVTELLVVTSRRKKALDDWFDRDPELEEALAEAPAKLARALPPRLSVTFVRQQRMAGTGDAILLAREFAGREPLVVVFPDDLLGRPNATAQVLEAHHDTGASVLGVADLAGQDVSAYGVVDAVPEGRWLRVRDFVEKPAPGHEPSKLVSLGRFVYTPDLLDALARSATTHHGGELYPMAAMREVAARGELVARVLDAERWDTGSTLGYLQAVVDHALAREGLGQALQAWLRTRLRTSLPPG